MAVYNPKTKLQDKPTVQPEPKEKLPPTKKGSLFDYEGHELISERIVENMKVGITGVEEIDDRNVERAVEYSTKLRNKEFNIKKKQIRGSYNVVQEGVKILHGTDAEEVDREIFNEKNPKLAGGPI